MDNNVRLQNLREMTVQIRRVSDDAIVGTGIAVSTNGAIVTCAHVVEAAIGAHPRDADGTEIGVYFPQARGGETKERRATVAACFPQHDDDVVLLQLVGGASPLAPEQIAVLGHAEKSDEHGFRSYGYRRLEKYSAGLAHGTILGCIEPPENQNVQCDPVQLESNQINQGMSGAAVLDVERNLVVGIVSETWFPDKTMKDSDTAWAVNARVLSLAPLGLQIQDEAFPLRAVPSSSVRAQIIGAMLGAGRYLFVLDGLEVMQHQEGDRFGLLQSNDLRDLLTYFARPDNQSFCLVTSRAPLLDLMEYTTYTHRDVDRLSASDGRALLQKLGVQGKDDALDKLVADWDGHALTLSLLAAILTERYGGDVAHVADLPAPTMNEPRYERVHRVLRRYDEHLTDAEREFLKLFSAFRTPVREDALEKVFVPLLKNITTEDTGNTEKTKNKNSVPSALSVVQSLVARLVTYRILRFDAHERTYTTHPLIRNHYLALLTKGNAAQEKAAHEQIKDYYLSIAGDTPEYPTLEDLKPLIEVVHHACQAGAYDEAHNIRRDRIDQGMKFILLHQLGAYETTLNLMRGFFPNSDTTQEPQCIEPSANRYIVNRIGFCLMGLGHLREAVPFYERAVKAAVDAQDWFNASRGSQNLVDLRLSLGELKASAQAASQALNLAHRAENKQEECDSLLFQAWAHHLLGDFKSATTIYFEAEKLQCEIQPSLRYHYSTDGVKHADHLRRTGQSDYARRVTEANLELIRRNHWSDDASRCHRVLGDLDSDSSSHLSAHNNYNTALKIARGTSDLRVLIEALLARGRWVAKFMKDAMSAFNDLNEALGYAVDGGYRIYEADIRVALAWAHLVASSQSTVASIKSARDEAERALKMSEEMGYYWGKVDAEEVLKEFRSQ